MKKNNMCKHEMSSYTFAELYIVFSFLFLFAPQWGYVGAAA